MRDSMAQAVDSVMAPPEGAASDMRYMSIRFTGSGSEYFRIWIVNLLLVLVTLTLYYPWAKVRRLRYFYGNTLVDGTPLGFHGDPRKMLRGYLLVGLLFLLYSVAGKFSVSAGLIALALVAAIVPALLKSSMRFRLANTSWRGMRLRFAGSLGDAYRAVLPLFVPGLVLAGALPLVLDPKQPPLWYGLVALAVFLVSGAVLPWLFWKLKRYQHAHYSLASLQTGFKATIGSFYALAFKSLGVSLLALASMAALIGALAYATKIASDLATGAIGMSAALMLLPFAAMLILVIVVRSYLTSRLQNLVWSKTGNKSMRFLSGLTFTRLFWLTLKNWLLMVCTLGLYWPFAAVATTRLRVEAVTIKTRQDPAMLVNLLKASDGDAAGDAAGDLLGLDIGL